MSGDERVEYDYADCVKTVKELTEISKRLQSMFDTTTNELKQVDLEVCDIQHAAEFHELNAAQGYNLYRMLHDATIRRRKIKNKLKLLQWVREKKLFGINGDNLNRKLAEIDGQQYIPRVLNELFDV